MDTIYGASQPTLSSWFQYTCPKLDGCKMHSLQEENSCPICSWILLFNHASKYGGVAYETKYKCLFNLAFYKWYSFCILCSFICIMLLTSLIYDSFSFSSPLELQTRVAAIFVFVSFTSLLSIAGIPAHLKEIKVFFNSNVLMQTSLSNNNIQIWLIFAT